MIASGAVLAPEGKTKASVMAQYRGLNGKCGKHTLPCVKDSIIATGSKKVAKQAFGKRPPKQASGFAKTPTKQASGFARTPPKQASGLNRRVF